MASAMSGVWNAPPTLSGVTRRTPSSLARAEPASTPSGVPAITTWPGALSLATQHAVGRRGARVVGLLERGAEQRGHAAGVRVGRGLRELGATGGEAHAVVEGEHARRDERGDLTERVAGERDGVVERGVERLPHDERGEQHRELGFAGAGERLGAARR